MYKGKNKKLIKKIKGRIRKKVETLRIRISLSRRREALTTSSVDIEASWSSSKLLSSTIADAISDFRYQFESFLEPGETLYTEIGLNIYPRALTDPGLRWAWTLEILISLTFFFYTFCIFFLIFNLRKEK